MSSPVPPPPDPGPGPGRGAGRGRALRLGAAAVVPFVVWAVLVVVAVRQVNAARSGEDVAWVWAAIAAAGAVAALVAALLAGVRLREAPAPPRVKGGKRAAR